ncbi:tetratricopeptide repeat protein [Arenimonas composti]|uniref:protein O-GlcNAc transferase n=1 Tax=Arenimonas composti TR7-09 = DSM 18010 TaxID=1121013 RepID=A0A091BE89_9GAMM|nr:tetratricopeptide repeat protein [Arenimonas composti]KFN49847.1 hypothetical protein P873_08985 [Arenimonas composti TR7-09 = DSM 18010]
MPPPGGNALLAQATAAFRAGHLHEALRLLDALVRAEPGNADAWNLAGASCHRLREYAAAARYFERSLAIRPRAGVGVNLGFALERLGRGDDALRAYVEATRTEPTLAIAWQKLGALHEARGEAAAALAAWRRAFALDRDDLRSLGDALSLRRDGADWDQAETPTPSLLLETFARVPRSDFPPGLLLALPEADAAVQHVAAAKFARSQWEPLLAAPPLAAPARAHDGPLRIGYLSADFRGHAVSFLTLEALAAHDRDAVHVSLYAYGPPAGDDPWRQRAIALADAFVDIDALDDEAAARRIAADRVDVLVDLGGYTRHARAGILARRPAPVQAHWLGYVGTLGDARLAGYVIGDAVAIPPAVAAHMAERVALLPRCFQANGSLQPLPPPPPRAALGLGEDAVVFCSFNQAHKLHPALWDDWCAILRAVPRAQLWLVVPKAAGGADRLRRETEARGVDPRRLVFAPMAPRDAHLARLQQADIALDTWPYNSGTTASDALRCGVPLLAFAGDTFAGRMAASLLGAAGLRDCLRVDRADVVAEAVRLGNDDRARAALRREVAARIPASGLYEPARIARELEDLYRWMFVQEAR